MLNVFLQTLIIIGFITIFALAIIKALQNTSCNIAVYSGTFNPLHIGHKAIIDNLSKKYDWVYVIVTPQSPTKSIQPTPTEICSDKLSKTLVKHEYFNVVANNIENEIPPPYYTVHTLQELKKRKPNNNFTLAIGADNLTNIKEWKDYEVILRDFGVIVFPRGEQDVEYLENLKKELLKENCEYNITIERTIIPTISSTQIREASIKGENVEYLLM